MGARPSDDAGGGGAETDDWADAVTIAYDSNGRLATVKTLKRGTSPAPDTVLNAVGFHYSALGLPVVEEAAEAVPVPEGATRITLTAEHDTFAPAAISAKQNDVLQFEIVNKDSYDHIFGSGDANTSSAARRRASFGTSTLAEVSRAMMSASTFGSRTTVLLETKRQKRIPSDASTMRLSM